MDRVICKVVNNVVYKAMRYDPDSIYGDLDNLLTSLVLDTILKDGWQIISLDTYRSNIENEVWTELDDEDVILSLDRDIWDDYD